MTHAEHRRITVVDSHTEGEPTRLVVSGGPDLGNGPLSDRLERFRTKYDDLRSAVVNEPRGSDVMVGGLLCDPVDPTCTAGVIFFNNVGYLGMCGHGTIGLVATLAYMNRIAPGAHRIETPVGVVSAILHASGEVTVNNVASHRSAANVAVKVGGDGSVRGDVAWGGNWFFLVSDHGRELELQNIDELTSYTWNIRQALRANGITGETAGKRSTTLNCLLHLALCGWTAGISYFAPGRPMTVLRAAPVRAPSWHVFTLMARSGKVRSSGRRVLSGVFSREV
jgi:4-hydroxyproline epimerase